MIKPNHSKVFGYFFDIYISRAFRRNFSRIVIRGEIKDAGLPVLVIANHISWWDGFWIRRLNQLMLHRRFHVMMLEEQLTQHPFLAKLGAFSIKKRSRTLRQSLEYASAILGDPRNMLLFFPQGKISSQHDIPVKFEKGLEYILRQTGTPVQIIMVANLTDYFSNPRPVLNQYIFSPVISDSTSLTELENIYNRFYRECISQQKESE